ncbi:MAG: response regulator [Candidatus Omnitrophica bacterium]|nr:response regulator [Candidatus Omnitrophota bacterium]
MFSRPIRILVVDDDPEFRHLLKENLHRAGNCRVITEKGASMGGWIARCPWHKPDVILLDIRMPKTNGLELLKILKTHHNTSDIPVIMLTAVDDDIIRSEAQSLRCADYIVKPIPTADLVERIEKILPPAPPAQEKEPTP